MKTLCYLLISFTSSTYASACVIYIPEVEFGAKKIYGQADLKEFSAKGYEVTNDERMLGQGALSLSATSSCVPTQGFQVCSYRLQLGRTPDGSTKVGSPGSGESIATAISKLPSCSEI